MIPNYKKKKSHQASHSIWLHVGGISALVICVGLIVADVHMYQTKREFNTQVADLKNQVASLQTSNNDLKQKMGDANNSQEIERIAREEGDLQMPGETVVSFVMPKNQPPKTDSTSGNFLQAWLGASWNWIKSIF